MGLFDFWRGKRIKLTDGKFWSAFAGAYSHAGETVNDQKVLSLSAAYACVRKISEGVSCLPFEMLRQDGAGGSQVDTSHRLAGILGDVANADMTAQQYFELVTLELSLKGNHYSLKLMLGGDLVGLEPLPAWPDTYCKRDKNGDRKFFVMCGPRKGEYDDTQIFFIPGFGTDPDCGLSVVGVARHTFGRLLAGERHQARVLANGARPNMIMTSPGVLNEAQRAQVKNNLIEPFTGPDNSGGMMLLEGGFKVDTVNMSPADLELLAQSKFGVEEVCRLFGVPPWLIGHSDGNSNWGTGLEQQFRAYATLTLGPYTKRILGEIRRQLMTREERQKYKIRMSMDDLLRGDLKTEAEVDAIYVRGGIKTANEVRAPQGLAALPGGDALMVQQQMIPAVMASNGEGNE